MKLRQLPEDFIVTEIARHHMKDRGEFRLYELRKTGLETFELMGYLSSKNRIPISDIGIAGLKDRHAITTQFLTIPAKHELRTLREPNFTIRPLGYLDRPIKLGDLEGNRFEITVRDIQKGEIEGIYPKAATIGKIGVPNYFDSQRFGSVMDREFMAKYLLQKDYEHALKIFLTKFSRFESAKIKQDKRLILDKWEELGCVEVSNTLLARPIEEYKRTGDWLKAYKKIPANVREMVVSAYQSYLWNECVKRLLKRTIDKRRVYPIEYSVGSLLFYKSVTDAEVAGLPDTFRTISHDIASSGTEKSIIEEVLAKEGITLADFDIRKATDNFFKSSERSIIVRPADFEIEQPAKDELNDRGTRRRYKVALRFTMPKGSFATIVTKRLFNK